MDRQAAARAIEDFLRALGHAPEGELADTGRLVAEAWAEDLLTGQAQDPAALLREGAIDEASADPVVLRDLVVTSVCPHHLMPSHGFGDLAFVPGGRIAGLGALSRALRAATRRLILQERAGRLAADALLEGLGARGAWCRLRMTHTCLCTRGVREPVATVESVAFAGSFAPGGADHGLALALLGAGKG